MTKKAAKRRTLVAKTEAKAQIERLWGDVPVVDAKRPLRVFVQPEDVAAAVRKDPGCCVFAQACKRQFAATKVLFFKSVAYVELPTRNGGRRVERFQMPRDMRSLIENFDRGKAVDNFAGFELLPPNPSYTLDGLAEQNKLRAARKKEALLQGRVVEANGRGRGKYEKPPIVIDLEVRNGKGRVQFKKAAGRRA